MLQESGSQWPCHIVKSDLDAVASLVRKSVQLSFLSMRLFCITLSSHKKVFGSVISPTL